MPAVAGGAGDAHIRPMNSSTVAAATIRWADGRRAAAAALVRQGLDWAYAAAVAGMPGLDSAENLAAGYAARHPTTDAAVKALVARHAGMAGAAGFITGCGGFVSLPAALPANLASVLYLQVRLVAAIAHLRGHDINSAEVRALVLACLAGSRAADTLKDAGVRFAARLTRDAAGWVAPAWLGKVQHAALPAACAAGHAAGRCGRLVPVVGGIVAGGFDAAMTRLIGRTADRVFSRLDGAARANAGTRDG
jgi:uncharacterized protein (DUF697 family)